MHDAHIDIRLRKNIKSKMTRTSWSAGCIRRKFVKAALLCALQINMAVAHFILAHIVSLLRGIGISWAPATLHWNSLASWHSRSVFLRICPTLFIDHGHGARKLYMPYIYIQILGLFFWIENVVLPRKHTLTQHFPYDLITFRVNPSQSHGSTPDPPFHQRHGPSDNQCRGWCAARCPHNLQTAWLHSEGGGSQAHMKVSACTRSWALAALRGWGRWARCTPLLC